MSKSTEVAMPSEPKKDERDYEAENALDNLMKAEEHKQDPEMMKRVHKIAGRKHKALQGIRETKPFKSIEDIKAYSKKKYPGPGLGKDDGDGDE